MSLKDIIHDYSELAYMRSRGFAFIAVRQFQDDSAMAGDQSALEDILSSYQAADKLLHSGIGDKLAAVGMEMTEELARDEKAAASALSEGLAHMRKLGTSGPLDGSQLRQTFDHHQSTVVPALTSFLNRLQGFESDAEAVARDDQRSVIDTAVMEIDDINSVINLISVNASVEAARAGDAGRGFAVIASEIQTLSQRSKQAVHDIRNRLR